MYAHTATALIAAKLSFKSKGRATRAFFQNIRKAKLGW
jgi:hypothetical protein